MRFEHDINDNTTIRNTTRWSRVKQDYLMTAIMGGASNITQPTSDVNSWTWSRTANTKDVSNKILTNQTNLTSTFYTGSIGHDVSTGVEFTRETQTNYGVNPVTLPAVNIYHPDSSIHPGGLTRNGANANGQTDTFAIYAFDTLQITRDFELNGGIRLDNIILNMTVPPPAAAADAVPSPAQLVWQKVLRSPPSTPPSRAIW
ncbi:TonB-dependent receptor Fiu [Escherichia coli]|uniref:TonB-dependent receptor Fiu n=1 Tax=Escherichia coli TaxID=562 RepID=A0A376UDB2_ECOLX|nr:TonB-dependent receptor Fiu [Escherichia coli]